MEEEEWSFEDPLQRHYSLSRSSINSLSHDSTNFGWKQKKKKPREGEGNRYLKEYTRLLNANIKHHWGHIMTLHIIKLEAK